MATTTATMATPEDPHPALGGSEEDHPERLEEAMQKHAEFGVVGWVENDESDYDHRRCSHKSMTLGESLRNSSYQQQNNISMDADEGKERDDDDDEDDDDRIEFSQRIFGREKEIAQLEQVYQMAMGIFPEEDEEEENDNKNKKEEQKTEAPPKPNNNKRTISMRKASSHKRQPPLQVVFLKGFSGSGKTALVMEAVRSIQTKYLDSSQIVSDKSLLGHQRNANILIHGKYDSLRHVPIPYKALTVALKRWYRSLSPGEKRALLHVQQDLDDAVANEDSQNLAEILPFLSKLITGYEDGADSISAGDNDTAASSTRTGVRHRENSIGKTRIHFAFQCLFRSLCRHSRMPLILFLDDLQWADSYSLELLTSLLSPNDKNDDEEHRLAISRLVFIGAYRENEVTPQLARLIDTLHKKNAEQLENNEGFWYAQESAYACAPITTISIHDLARDQLGAFIADTLELPTDEVQPVTNAIFKKTMGNVYFARQALEELVRQNALYYDMMTFQWQWGATSEEKLAEKLTNDITEIVRSKIQALPEQLQQILVVASYLGVHFDYHILIAVLNALKKEDAETKLAHDMTSLSPLLDRAVKEGLLAQSMEGKTIDFSFAHDRVREVTQSMVMDKESKHDHDQLLMDIGTVLVQNSTDDTDTLNIVTDRGTFFLGMHHLNLGAKSKVLSDEEVFKLALLNLHAAKESLTDSAFENALDFADGGIAFLVEKVKKENYGAGYNERVWRLYPGLMHRLHEIAAEAARLHGDFVAMEMYCKTCLAAEKDRPLDNLFPIYFTLASGLMYGTNRLDEAKDILLKLLEHLGCTFPSTTTGKLPSIVKELLSLVLFKKRWKPGTIENMGYVEEWKRIEMVKLLQKLGELCYTTSDMALSLLSLFKRLNHCLQNNGMTVYTAGNVAAISIIFAGPLNDLQSARTYAEYGIEMMDRIKYKPTEPLARASIYYFGLPWTTPVAECITPLRVGYQTGINTGMTEHATMCSFGAMILAFQASEPLAELEGLATKRVSSMEEWGHRSQTILVKGLLRLIMALRGVSRDHVATFEEFEQEDEVPSTVHEFLASYERIEWTLLGNFESCADHVVKTKAAFMKSSPANPAVHVHLFMSGLSCLHMYRTTRKNKYRKEAKRINGILSKWAKQGNPNVLHWIELFNAENAFIRRRAKVADEKYSLAIKLALDGGYKQDAAIFYERWGICTLKMADNKNEEQHAIGDSPASKAADRMHEAVRLYSMWGAFEIVRRLKERYPALLAHRSSELY